MRTKECKYCGIKFTPENEHLFELRYNILKDGTKKYTRRKNKYNKCGIKALSPFREYLKELKTNTCCTDCKNHYPYYVMQFDHVRGKKLFHLTQSIKVSPEILLEEINKCEIVCANCHAIRTFTRKQIK